MYVKSFLVNAKKKQKKKKSKTCRQCRPIYLKVS